METLSHIADRLEAKYDFAERLIVLDEHEAEIVNILDILAFEKQVKPVMRVHVVRWFKDIDYDIDPRLADEMARMVRSLYPQEPAEDYGE